MTYPYTNTWRIRQEALLDMFDFLPKNLVVSVFQHFGFLSIGLIKGTEELVHEIYPWKKDVWRFARVTTVPSPESAIHFGDLFVSQVSLSHQKELHTRIFSWQNDKQGI